MPTYEYVCSKCDQHLEVYQSFSEEPLKRHAGCGGKLSKVLGSVGIVLKGSGFYRTDNASSSRRSAERSESSSGSDSSKTESKLGLRRREDRVQAGGQARQEDRQQEVGLAGPGRRRPPATRGVTATPTPPKVSPPFRGSSMLRRSPRTTIAWVAAAIVAVVTAITVVSLLASLQHQDEAYGALHPLAVARRDLPVGTRVRARRRRGTPDPRRRARDRCAHHASASSGGSCGSRCCAGRPSPPATSPLAARRSRRGRARGSARGAPRRRARAPTRGRRPGRRARDVRSRDARRRRRPDDRRRARGHGARRRRGRGRRGDTVAVTVLVTPAQSTRLAFAAAAGTISLALAPPEAAARADPSRRPAGRRAGPLACRP